VRSHIEERAIVVAKYILEKNTTVRQTAKTFGVSKSTIHKDVTERLEEINPSLAQEVKKVLENIILIVKQRLFRLIIVQLWQNRCFQKVLLLILIL
jgi:sporulation transcriptional regulator SpoIIID